MNDKYAKEIVTELRLTRKELQKIRENIEKSVVISIDGKEIGKEMSKYAQREIRRCLDD